MTRRTLLRSAALLLLLPVSMVAAVALGAEGVAPVEVLRVVMHHFGAAITPDPIADRIVWQLRLPRALLALLVGGGLSVSGIAMQALVRNPLADPYLLGISSGASAGASLFYLGLLPPLLTRWATLPLAAFAGGLGAILLVYAVAHTRQGVSVTRLLLSGVAVSAMMAAVTSFVTLASPDANRTRAVLFWLLGSFNNAHWAQLPLPLGFTFAGATFLYGIHRYLDAFLLGEEPAFNLGVPVETVKRMLIVVAALVTGAAVSVSGTIGFVGLIIPHAVRSMLGVSHRVLIPAGFVAGAIFTLWADIVSRTLLPSEELPVGIVTALCGVPFFLALLRRGQYRFG